jgi:ParB-like nuclease domain
MSQQQIVHLGCTPYGENIIHRERAAGILLHLIEQPDDGLFPLDSSKVMELVESIEGGGLLEPIHIMPIPGANKYEILFGKHRYTAVCIIRDKLQASLTGKQPEDLTDQEKDMLGQWTKIPAFICSYISDQNAKDLIRIDENLVRQEISPARRAELVAKKVELEGIVRKGNFSGRKPISGREKLVAESVTNVVTGQGVKSPAAQLFEQLGYAKSTGQSRFKEWAFQTGYKGPMSSVEGDDLKSLAQFCADFEAAKKKKGSNKEADKEAKEKAARDARIAKSRAKLRDALIELSVEGEEVDGVDINTALRALGVS